MNETGEETKQIGCSEVEECDESLQIANLKADVEDSSNDDKFDKMQCSNVEDGDDVNVIKNKINILNYSDVEGDDDQQIFKEESQNVDFISCEKSGSCRSKKTLKSLQLIKEEKKKIFSESQRMTRETSISLPHHKAKQVSLSDFLNRKKKVKVPLKICTDSAKAVLVLTSEPSSPEGPVIDSAVVLADDTQPSFVAGPSFSHQEEDADDFPTLKLENSEAHESLSSKESVALSLDQDELSLKSLKTSMMKSLKSFTPKLNGGNDSLVELTDEIEDDVKIADGLDKFMDRFSKHSYKRRVKKESEIWLSIVEKKVDDEGREMLKESKISVVTPASDHNVFDESSKTPGSGLIKLKKSLRAKMSVKKEQSRKKRIELHQLDNEKFDDDEEEEAELTESEEEGEVDCANELDKDVRNEMFNKMAEQDEDEPDEKIFTGDDDESSDDDEIITSCKKRKSVIINEDDDESEQSDRQDDLEEGEETSACLDEPTKDEMEESYEIATLEPYQKQTVKQSIDNSDHESSFTATPLLQNDHSFTLMPIEDSQDLFEADDDEDEDPKIASLFKTPSNDSILIGEEKRKEFSCKRSLMLDDSQSIQDKMDELLGLCSGKFTGVESSMPSTLRSQNSNNMADLIGLCSGTFQNSGNEALSTVQLVTDRDDKIDFKKYDSDEDELQLSLNKEVDQVEDSDDDSFVDYPKEANLNFFEDEAELSGSEAESDEDLDIADEDDVLEEELGDRDILPDEDELKDQVGRVHFKTMMDEDKKELRLYKEMYLEDGDLHGNGETRSRAFRWKNIDDKDDGHRMVDSDEEATANDDVDAEYVDWRLQRNERQKWMQDKNVEIEAEEDDGTNDVLYKHKQDRNSLKRRASEDVSLELTSLPNNPINKRGSFLSRKRTCLDKIAQFSGKAVNSNLLGARQTGNFVFSVVSPTSAKENSKKMTKVAPDDNGVKKAKVLISAQAPTLKRSTSLFSYL